MVIGVLWLLVIESRHDKAAYLTAFQMIVPSMECTGTREKVRIGASSRRVAGKMPAYPPRVF